MSREPLALAKKTFVLSLTTCTLACGGGGGGSGPDPCATCPPGNDAGLHCYVESGAKGTTSNIACVQMCARGCPGGSSCVTNAGEQVCSPYCSTVLCPDRMQCTVEEGVLAECEDVPGDCSNRVPCLDRSDVCDPLAYACFPANGACTSSDECPHLERDYAKSTGSRELLVTTCNRGFCRIAPAAPDQVAGLETVERVPITRPQIAESFTSRDDVVLAWDAGGNASIAEIFGAPPADKSDVEQLVMWADSLTPGYAQYVHPATSGEPWQGGRQVGGVGLDERGHGTLYLLVQAMNEGTRLRTSALIPFFVGGTWPVDGAPCTETPASSETSPVPGECANPGQALACIDGTCRMLCASHLDCAASTSGSECGAIRLLPSTSGAVVWYRACE